MFPIIFPMFPNIIRCPLGWWFPFNRCAQSSHLDPARSSSLGARGKRVSLGGSWEMPVRFEHGRNKQGAFKQQKIRCSPTEMGTFINFINRNQGFHPTKIGFPQRKMGSPPQVCRNRDSMGGQKPRNRGMGGPSVGCPNTWSRFEPAQKWIHRNWCRKKHDPGW